MLGARYESYMMVGRFQAAAGIGELKTGFG